MLARSSIRCVAAAAAETVASAAASMSAAKLLTDEIVDAFHRDGITCIPRFVAPEVCDQLRAQAGHYIEAEAARRAADGSGPVAHFNTETKEHADNEYFMTSGNKIRFFLESGCDTVSVNSVNKIGHALHTDGGVFQQFCQRPEFGGLLRRLGQRAPTAIQSMYILKPPKVGGVVVPHQDSTWLHTSPLSVIGVWFALEDCTVHNSCLLGLKGSHYTHPLKARALLDEGSTLQQTLHGDLPDVPLEKMEPIECPKGSLVFFNGQCIHASGPNTSTKSRHAFVFHSVDSRCTWNERNWIAPTVSRLAL